MQIASAHPGLLAISAVGLFLASAAAWAAIAEVETAANAPVRIIPQGQVKTVAAFEAGETARIAVAEGSAVEAGELLVALDTTLIEAELAKLVAELAPRRLKAPDSKPCSAGERAFCFA